MRMQVAKHLAETYGSNSIRVAKLAGLSGRKWPAVGTRLHPEYPYIDAEVLWACKEYAQTAVDVLARRLLLAFLNMHAAQEALPTVVQIMAKELHWDKKKQKVGTCRQFTFRSCL